MSDRGSAARFFVEIMKRAGIFLAGILMLVWLAGCETGPRFDAHATTQARLATLTNLAPVTVTNTADASLLQPPSEHFTLGPGATNRGGMAVL